MHVPIVTMLPFRCKLFCFSYRVLFIILFVTMAHASGKQASLSREEELAIEKVIEGTNKFAISLFRALSSGTDGNVFVSPLSVQLVLALAFTGAKGDTASELAKLLSLPDKLEDTYNGYGALIKALQDPVLKLATRMFVEASAGVKEEFQANAEKHFQSPAEAVDFRTAAEKSREMINSWVEKQTNNKITNLLAPGMVDADTRLILINAIHFKANWKQKFLEKETFEDKFFITKTNTVLVKMMHTKKKFGFRYDSELKAKILELVYEGFGFRMVVILPDAVDGLSQLEEQLGTVNLSEKIRYLRETTVTVALPKFKLEETMNLNSILKTLGAMTMFDSKADFGGLSDERLFVSDVIQKAFVEVNEEGTEAAAATVMVLMRRSKPREEVFTVDHPFLFLICHRDFGILFIGRYSNAHINAV